ncbi:SMC family ATPase [Nonomuraea sp. NBC_01738]|uniref:SMC family ATPase n=1 Tax=Nonomuraea sp. NBC_01738 TaxID=2976003 RepID=UPI002E101DF0|nr:SMC family ATPase [Nonomuraea sp. NBC_01738]
MRPLQLFLDGFGSYRSAVTLDFSDVDYFALVGPTGAGKSMIIDAICFALYGTVPRWSNEKAVADALAPSATSGKVALVFESGGRRHAVVRAMQRDAKGRVHTREARLDELDPAQPASVPLADLLDSVVRPVAEGEQVTQEIVRITGLAYRFFTQCVVLPQGRFAEFLHAPRRERQDLLVQLLDAEVYEEIMRRAGAEAKAAAQSADYAREELASLAGATGEAEQAAESRLARLTSLAARLGGDLDLLARHDDDLRTLRADYESRSRSLSALTSLTMPAGVPTLSGTLREARENAAAHATTHTALTDAEHAAENDRALLGDRDLPAGLLSSLDDLDTLAADLSAARAGRTTAASHRAETSVRQADAAESSAGAEHALEHLRDAHTAADLATRLTTGDPCPICLRTVTDLPRHPSLPGLVAAQRAVRDAKTALDTARDAHHRAELAEARATEQVTGLEARHERALGRMESALSRVRAEEESAVPREGERQEDDPEGRAASAVLDAPAARRWAAARIEAIDAADEALTRARAAARKARQRTEAAEREVAALAGKAERAWRDLEAARDTVVALGAPPLERDDPHAAWQSLLTWRDKVTGEEQAALAVQEDKGREAALKRKELGDELAHRLAEHEVEARPETAREGVATAVAQAGHRLEQVRRDRARAAGLAERADTRDQEARVARELARLLRADGFEEWLCGEALDLLVAAASDTLRDLSGGQYELTLGQKGDIEVIDYAEGGLRRGVRTLSGGETFQAALALALALSSQVMTTSRSLDSIFLDEGFGSLDPATLDTVAATLERLAAAGDRMVGVVTHVPALAERVPVRFEVSRDGTGSHLRRHTP